MSSFLFDGIHEVLESLSTLKIGLLLLVQVHSNNDWWEMWVDQILVEVEPEEAVGSTPWNLLTTCVDVGLIP